MHSILGLPLPIMASNALLNYIMMQWMPFILFHSDFYLTLSSHFFFFILYFFVNHYLLYFYYFFYLFNLKRFPLSNRNFKSLISIFFTPKFPVCIAPHSIRSLFIFIFLDRTQIKYLYAYNTSFCLFNC